MGFYFLGVVALLGPYPEASSVSSATVPLLHLVIAFKLKYPSTYA
jgi:hypothetical protein